MGILEQIKKDHEEVRGIFEKLMNSRTDKSRETGFEELRGELVPHMSAEESVFYPALMAGDSKQEVLEGLEEHHASQFVLKELEKTAKGDERWPAKLKVLKEMIEHHIKEEESQIFKAARSNLDKQQLQELGDKFDSKKQHIKKRF